MKYLLINIICIVLVNINPDVTYSQEKSEEKDCYIRLRGIAEESKYPSMDVNVKLLEGNSVVEEITTDFEGTFEFRLDTGKNYMVVISKPGYITKKLAFLTYVPKNVYGIWTNDFAVRMVKECEGVDLSGLKNPIDEIKFHVRSQSFTSDPEYSRKMFKILDNIYYALDNCHYEKYNNLIKRAEELYKDDKLSESKELFREASEMMPSENYPRKKMYEIIAQLQIINADLVSYKELKSEGDKYLTEKKYEEALKNYEKAYEIKKDDPDLLAKMNQTRQKINEELVKNNNEKLASEREAQQKEQQFRMLVNQAEGQYKNKQYIEAKNSYEKARLMKPGDQLVISRINTLNDIIKKQEQENLIATQKESQYKDLITQANNLLSLGELLPAKQKYEQASTIKPGDPVLISKINEINQRIEKEKQKQITEQQKLLAEQEKQKQFQTYVTNGNNFLNNNQLELAKAEFQKALQVNPQDVTSRQKVTQINQKLQQQELTLKQQQEKENAYNNNIKNGENLLTLGQYEQARQTFQMALVNKPGDTYATQKVTEINNAIQKQRQEEMEIQNRENQYKQYIEKANSLLQTGELAFAKIEYQKAINLKPGDPVASAKIREVEQLINQKQQQELITQQQTQKYNDLVKKADNFYNSKNYEDALSTYQQALALKPLENHPATRVDELNKIIEEKQKDEQIKEEYENTLKLANNYYNKNDYNNAKTYYQKALVLQPNSYYPKQQLEKINKAQELAQENSQTTSGKSVLNELKFKNENERNDYMLKLARKYPDGITLEVYKEEFKTTYRYIIIRDGQANEYREVRHSWGGIDYSLNDKAVNDLYFKQQTKRKEGEYYKKFDM